MLRSASAQHEGVLCRGVRWERFGLDELVTIAQCVGGRQLAAVLRLLAQDHGGWAGGCFAVWARWVVPAGNGVPGRALAWLEQGRQAVPGKNIAHVGIRQGIL
jgi:hypothetical protein